MPNIKVISVANKDVFIDIHKGEKFIASYLLKKFILQIYNHIFLIYFELKKSSNALAASVSGLSLITAIG